MSIHFRGEKKRKKEKEAGLKCFIRRGSITCETARGKAVLHYVFFDCIGKGGGEREKEGIHPFSSPLILY